MIYSPIGVFALLAGVIVQVSEGDIFFAFQILTGLGVYSITVIIGLFIMIFIVYPFLIKRFAKINLNPFLRPLHLLNYWHFLQVLVLLHCL